MSSERRCIYCGCTDSRACLIDIDDAQSIDTADSAFSDQVACSWLSLDPPVCSAPTCRAKHAMAVRAQSKGGKR